MVIHGGFLRLESDRMSCHAWVEIAREPRQQPGVGLEAALLEHFAQSAPLQLEVRQRKGQAVLMFTNLHLDWQPRCGRQVAAQLDTLLRRTQCVVSVWQQRRTQVVSSTP